MRKNNRMLVLASSLKRGDRFCKRNGEVVFTVIGTRGLKHYLGPEHKPNYVYAVSEDGRMDTREPQQKVHPVGHSGRCLTNLADAQQHLRSCEARLKDEQEERDRARYDVASHVGRVVGVDPENLAGILWGHECDTSPLGHCIYNTANDPCHDHCLCCGYPRERK